MNDHDRWSDKELAEFKQEFHEWKNSHEAYCVSVFNKLDDRLKPLEKAFIQASVPLWAIVVVVAGSLAWIGESATKWVTHHLK